MNVYPSNYTGEEVESACIECNTTSVYQIFWCAESRRKSPDKCGSVQQLRSIIFKDLVMDFRKPIDGSCPL